MQAKTPALLITLVAAISMSAEVAPNSSPASAEVPDKVVAQMRADLASRVGQSAAAAARIVRSQEVDWPNGALGCPKPGQMYTQAIVPGYQVDFDVGGKIYSYHAAASGSFVLCEGAGRLLAPPPRGSSE